MRRDAPANDACTVRLATPGDCNLLQSVLDNSSGAANSDIFGLNATELLQAHQVHLALNAGEPIGCVMVTIAKSSVIHNLAVVQAFRNQGHATTLIRAAIAYNDEAHAPESYWTRRGRRHGGRMGTVREARLRGRRSRRSRHPEADDPQVSASGFKDSRGRLADVIRPTVRNPRLLTTADARRGCATPLSQADLHGSDDRQNPDRSHGQGQTFAHGRLRPREMTDRQHAGDRKRWGVCPFQLDRRTVDGLGKIRPQTQPRHHAERGDRSADRESADDLPLDRVTNHRRGSDR